MLTGCRRTPFGALEPGSELGLPEGSHSESDGNFSLDAGSGHARGHKSTDDVSQAIANGDDAGQADGLVSRV